MSNNRWLNKHEMQSEERKKELHLGDVLCPVGFFFISPHVWNGRQKKERGSEIVEKYKSNFIESTWNCATMSNVARSRTPKPTWKIFRVMFYCAAIHRWYSRGLCQSVSPHLRLHHGSNPAWLFHGHLSPQSEPCQPFFVLLLFPFDCGPIQLYRHSRHTYHG